jgi:23S rRNA-/tRNA-specific pseudouridylate synthase
MKTRLHKYITDYLKSIGELGYTNPEVKRNIESCGVKINGILTYKQLEWVWDGSEVELFNWPKRILGDLSLIKIVYEDEYCIVINKPFGLVVEPGAGHVLDNVTSWLMENYPEQNFHKIYKPDDLTKMYAKHGILTQSMKESGRKTFELPKTGMVHRIDKNTQGLLLIAKYLESYVHFQKQFREHKVVKKYLAVVQGMVEYNYNVNNWQSRDYGNPVRNRLFWLEDSAMAYSPDSRFARSSIRPIYTCQESNQSLLEVQIMTGRMHQIRLQCEALGFALVSDNIYKSKSTIQYDFDLNPDNRKFLNMNPVENLAAESFQKIKTECFGEHKYCLIANELKIELPDGKMLEQIINEL